jgi:enoyl-CoA hydratase
MPTDTGNTTERGTMGKPFTTTISEGIAELVFDHPPVNAFDSNGWAAIAAEIEALGQRRRRARDHHRGRGAGRADGFCAGVDIKELAADRNLIVKVNKGNYDTFKAVHRNPKPVIVAVHGFVLGGGIGISGAADIVVASECARFRRSGGRSRRDGVVARTCSGCSRCRRCATCTSPAR